MNPSNNQRGVAKNDEEAARALGELNPKQAVPQPTQSTPDLDELVTKIISIVENGQFHGSIEINPIGGKVGKSDVKTSHALIVQLLNKLITSKQTKLLDALYWMYVQYCSGKNGHMFMGAGETASEILEEAGYIVVDNIGAIIKDNGDSEEQAQLHQGRGVSDE